LLHETGLRALEAWTHEIEAWPIGSHVFGHYAERTDGGDVICRTENVSACHRGVAGLVDGPLRELASDALGEPAVAFKDKLNYKHPGGAGFRPHQDVVAYPGAHRVLSILVAIDECTTASGCLWIAEDVDEELPVDSRGVVRDDVARALAWQAVEMAPGDALFIDGLTPHFSETNASDRARRVLVASFAPASDAYSRREYYAAREDVMSSATERDGMFRISTLADFAGERAPSSTSPADHCTHP
jgi:hypothetical protein